MKKALKKKFARNKTLTDLSVNGKDHLSLIVKGSKAAEL